MNEFNVQDGQSLTTPFSSKGSAILFLYSPRLYGTQVLRPYTYSITGNALDKLTYGTQSITAALNNRSIVSDPDVAGIMQPVSNGTPLDMSIMGNLWTFVLQLDITSPWLSGSSMGNAKACRRIIYSGVCLDEPISTITMWSGQPTLNENCPMRFTHVMESVVDPGVSATGNSTKTFVRSDMDVVDAALDQQANDTDLYIATPDRVLGSVDTASGLTTEGANALINQKRGVGIMSDLKSPMAHLRSLLTGLDQQIHLCEASEGPGVASHMSTPTDIYNVDEFKTGVGNEWAQLSSGTNEIHGGIAAGDICLLGFITSQFPDITVVPQQISTVSPMMSDGMVADQMKQNPKVVYSSMAASAISALANNFGFSDIDFSYDSWSGGMGTDRSGTFEVRNAQLLMPTGNVEYDKQCLANSLEMFRRQIIMDLVPTIKASGNGEFQMHVKYAINAETYVDLNFYDWASLQNDGVYETTNRLSNVGTTTIGTSDQFIHNGTVLDNFVHQVYGKRVKNAFGISAFGDGTMLDTAAPAQGGTGPILNPTFYG